MRESLFGEKIYMDGDFPVVRPEGYNGIYRGVIEYFRRPSRDELAKIRIAAKKSGAKSMVQYLRVHQLRHIAALMYPVSRKN